MADIEIFSPSTLGKPRGQYSQIASTSATRTYFIAGQLSANAAGEIIGDGDFDAQCTQIFHNVKTALEACGLGWENIVQFTTYLVDPRDIPKFMAFRLRMFPAFFPSGKYPPNTLLIVSRLVEEPFLVEVQPIAMG
jgi:enamine deaminase RidA (YjgF/YER057c/UK114 family)